MDPDIKPPAAGLELKSQRLEEEPMQVLDVLDLPQLYQRPTAAELLSILADLSSEPPSWELAPNRGIARSSSGGASAPLRTSRKVVKEGLPQYLTKIISSPLAWIEDEPQKEQVWEAASRRLTERSGRSAMGAITRTFSIPLERKGSSMEALGSRNPPLRLTDDRAGVPQNSLELTLHEPALTADNLGLKTWASSYLLAKRLSTLHETLPTLPEGALVLELGSGTGLVGLAAAVIREAHVILTDLPQIVPNLIRNVNANAAALAAHAAKANAAVLDWSNPGAFILDGIHNGDASVFPLILVADPIYTSEHPRLIVNAIDHHLSRCVDARVVVELPLREAYVAERLDFRSRMTSIGLIVLEEGEETGYDDWSSGNDEAPGEVLCYYSIWGWR